MGKLKVRKKAWKKERNKAKRKLSYHHRPSLKDDVQVPEEAQPKIKIILSARKRNGDVLKTSRKEKKFEINEEAPASVRVNAAKQYKEIEEIIFFAGNKK